MITVKEFLRSNRSLNSRVYPIEFQEEYSLRSVKIIGVLRHNAKTYFGETIIIFKRWAYEKDPCYWRMMEFIEHEKFVNAFGDFQGR